MSSEIAKSVMVFEDCLDVLCLYMNLKIVRVCVVKLVEVGYL